MNYTPALARRLFPDYHVTYCTTDGKLYTVAVDYDNVRAVLDAINLHDSNLTLVEIAQADFSDRTTNVIWNHNRLPI